MTADHPRVRAGLTCPVCHGHKASGLVVCWGCWRLYQVRYGNRMVEEELDALEARLRGAAYSRSPKEQSESNLGIMPLTLGLAGLRMGITASDSGVAREGRQAMAEEQKRTVPCPCGTACGLDTKGNIITPVDIRRRILGRRQTG